MHPPSAAVCRLDLPSTYLHSVTIGSRFIQGFDDLLIDFVGVGRAGADGGKAEFAVFRQAAHEVEGCADPADGVEVQAAADDDIHQIAGK